MMESNREACEWWNKTGRLVNGARSVSSTIHTRITDQSVNISMTLCPKNILVVSKTHAICR